MSTIDEFVAREYAASGKTAFTMRDVTMLTEKWIAYKTAAAAPFLGWKADEAIDDLMFGQPAEQDGQGAAQETPR